jgi:hypothetical protein
MGGNRKYTDYGSETSPLGAISSGFFFGGKQWDFLPLLALLIIKHTYIIYQKSQNKTRGVIVPSLDLASSCTIIFASRGQYSKFTFEKPDANKLQP